MSKDKQKKAQRAESGKDAKILKLEGELAEVKDKLYSTKSHLEECERSLEESNTARDALEKKYENKLLEQRSEMNGLLQEESVKLLAANTLNRELQARVTELEAVMLSTAKKIMDEAEA